MVWSWFWFCLVCLSVLLTCVFQHQNVEMMDEVKWLDITKLSLIRCGPVLMRPAAVMVTGLCWPQPQLAGWLHAGNCDRVQSGSVWLYGSLRNRKLNHWFKIGFIALNNTVGLMVKLHSRLFLSFPLSTHFLHLFLSRSESMNVSFTPLVSFRLLCLILLLLLVKQKRGATENNLSSQSSTLIPQVWFSVCFSQLFCTFSLCGNILSSRPCWLDLFCKESLKTVISNQMWKVIWGNKNKVGRKEETEAAAGLKVPTKAEPGGSDKNWQEPGDFTSVDWCSWRSGCGAGKLTQTNTKSSQYLTH